MSKEQTPIEELELRLNVMSSQEFIDWIRIEGLSKLKSSQDTKVLEELEMILMNGETEKCFTVSDVKDMLRDAMVQMSDWKNEGHTTPTLNPLMDKWIENKTK